MNVNPVYKCIIGTTYARMRLNTTYARMRLNGLTIIYTINMRVAGTRVIATLAHEIRRCSWRATRVTKGTCPRAIGIGNRSRARSTGRSAGRRIARRNGALNHFGFLDLTAVGNIFASDVELEQLELENGFLPLLFLLSLFCFTGVFTKSCKL